MFGVGRTRRAAGAAGIMMGLLACGGGGDDKTGERSAHMSVQVVVSAPLRGAVVSVDQLLLGSPGEVRTHVFDGITDEDGRVEVDGFGIINGLIRVTAGGAGASYDDPVTGTTIVLDPGDEIRSLFWLDLYEDRGAVVTPVGDLIETLTRSRVKEGLEPEIGAAFDSAAAHVEAHFGQVGWRELEALAQLDQPAPAPTPEAKAALMIGAWSTLADDIRVAAGAPPEEVHPLALLRGLREDLSAPPFDGNDGDVRGTGVQVGVCPPVDSGCVIPPESPTACPTGACRALCDLHSGTLRANYSGALLKFVRSPLNQTGITDAVILPTARILAENRDPVLFGSYCSDDVDRTAPTILFEEPPTPDDDEWVRQIIEVQVRAIDDLDPMPTIAFLDGLVDADGDVTNAVARVTLDTTAVADGPVTVRAEARDAARNTAVAMRSYRVDNTPPVVTVDPTGYYVAGSDWWTANPTPSLAGTVDELNLARVEVLVGGQVVATDASGGTMWSVMLPAGAVPGVAPVAVTVHAIDRAGNTAEITRTLRYDGTPPVVAAVPTTMWDESLDTVTFDRTVDPLYGFERHNPTHVRGGGLITLGTSTACDASTPVIKKYVHLLDEGTPAYVTEAVQPSGDGKNPIRWSFSLSDDGVGIDPAQSFYRVRHVDTNIYSLDWQPVNGNGTYTIPLYRRASNWPSIADLGTKQGRFEIQFRGRDRLGREVSLARCWQHTLLTPPVDLGSAGAASNGPSGSGKYALASLRLDDTTSPYDPIAEQVLASGARGVGLMQFTVWNPTTEPVVLSVDLINPSGATYSKSFVANRWSVTQSSANYPCGRVWIDDPKGGAWEPDESIPGCAAVGYPPPPYAGTAGSGMGAAAVTYGVRIFEEVGGTYTELTACAGCSATPEPGTSQRLTVALPARNPPSLGGTPAPPRKFWITPVVKGIPDLRPEGGPFYGEHNVGSVVITGNLDQEYSGCFSFEYRSLQYYCTSSRTYRRYRALTQATFALNTNVQARIMTSRDGMAPARPADHGTDDERRKLRYNFSSWTTNEVSLPATP